MTNARAYRITALSTKKQIQLGKHQSN